MTSSRCAFLNLPNFDLTDISPTFFFIFTVMYFEWLQVILSVCERRNANECTPRNVHQWPLLVQNSFNEARHQNRKRSSVWGAMPLTQAIQETLLIHIWMQTLIQFQWNQHYPIDENTQWVSGDMHQAKKASFTAYISYNNNIYCKH